jgi:Transposase DDE domain group 1
LYRPRKGHSDTGAGAGAEAHHSTLGSRVDADLSDFFPIRTCRAKLGLAGNAGATPELFEMLIGDAKLGVIEDSLLPFSFPAVGRKKITAAFDGGRITSDAGVMLLGQAERRLGVADKFAAVIADPRNPLLITHSLGSIFRARILAIACGYEDADDLDHLRKDPAFKLACGRLPDTGTIYARSPPYRVGRTRRPCAKS